MTEQNGKSTKEIIVYSTTWCPDCKRAKRFLGEQRVSYTNIDIEQDPQAMARVEAINHGMRSIPTIVFPDGDILVEPSNAQLAEKLGIQSKAQRSFYDAVVIGAGPTRPPAARRSNSGQRSRATGDKRPSVTRKSGNLHAWGSLMVHGVPPALAPGFRQRNSCGAN